MSNFLAKIGAYKNRKISASIATSISTSTTTPSSPFDMEEELAKISSSCLTPREHEELSGNLIRHFYALFFNQHLISEAADIIGHTEMRAALGFAPPKPWTNYRKPTEDEIKSASTIEEYFDLREPRTEDTSLDSVYFFEKNFPPVIAFLDKRFPAIRNIFKRKFEEILRLELGEIIDKKAVDHIIFEYTNNILPRVDRAIEKMYRRNNECRRRSERQG